MNGPTAACEIRKLGSDVFLVGITGNMLNEDVQHFKSMGANVVLPKPVQLPVLEEVLVEHGVVSGGGMQSTGGTDDSILIFVFIPQVTFQGTENLRIIIDGKNDGLSGSRHDMWLAGG